MVHLDSTFIQNASQLLLIHTLQLPCKEPVRPPGTWGFSVLPEDTGIKPLGHDCGSTEQIDIDIWGVSCHLQY